MTMITEVTSEKGKLCAEIIEQLPQWFGIPEANEAYRRDVENMPMFAAETGARIVGFLALNLHTIHAAEIHVMGVVPDSHRQGFGRSLIHAAEAWLQVRKVRFFTVKTLSARDPDPNFARTRAFYEAAGFVPIEEFPTLWNPANPALMMAKTIN
jgi:GNAT superfamily N-acetyltransferase